MNRLLGHVDEQNAVDVVGNAILKQLTACRSVRNLRGHVSGLDVCHEPLAAPAHEQIGAQLDLFAHPIHEEAEGSSRLDLFDLIAGPLEQRQGPPLGRHGVSSSTFGDSASTPPAQLGSQVQGRPPQEENQQRRPPGT